MHNKSSNLYKSPSIGIDKFHPFVKWAGGKTRLTSVIERHVPKNFSNYFEPFLGGGALFFHLKNTRYEMKDFTSYLSDNNPELINAYNIIKNKPQKLIALLSEFEKNYYNNPREFYYELRNNKLSDKIFLAARFITLNKTCYNGLYRVNKNGLFNVPLGNYIKPKICDEENLLNINGILKNTKTIIRLGDFENILVKNTKSNDFIYLDPPYDPIDRTSNFTSYTNTGFNIEQQKRLSDLFHILDCKGCKLLLSNSDTETIRELYKDFSNNILKIESIRSINSKPEKRSGHVELLIKNYK